MGLLVDRDWPEALTGTLQDVLAQVPVETLAEAVAALPAFATGGFRPGAMKPETLRRRVLQLLRGSGDVPDHLRRIVASHSLQRSIVALLSGDLLVSRLADLGACFGEDAVILGMLLDARDSVRDAGARRLADRTQRPDSDPTRARRVVEDLFAGLLGALTPVLEAAARDEGLPVGELPSAQGERLALLERELRDARAKAARIDGLEGKVVRLEASVAAQRRDVERWRATADENARLASAAEAEAARLRGALDEFRSTYERDVERAVAAGLARAERAWLREANAAAELASDGAATELADRARQLLERQRSVDRRAGTRSALRGRAENLAALRAQILQAQDDALSPLSELVGVVKEIDGELARLARVPGIDAATPRDPAVLRMLARISAADETELAELDRACAMLERLGCLAEHDRLALGAARRDRLARKMAAAAADAGCERAADPGEGFQRAWHALGGSPPGATLLVDGHNLLLNPDLEYVGDGPVGESERRRLARDVGAIVGHLAEGDARLYFDGPTASEEALGPKVLAVFSGGVGANRADDRIVDDLRFRRQRKTGLRSVLLTDDRELRARALREDARLVVLGAVEFALLRRCAAASPARVSEPGPRPVPAGSGRPALKKRAGGLR